MSVLGSWQVLTTPKPIDIKERVLYFTAHKAHPARLECSPAPQDEEISPTTVIDSRKFPRVKFLGETADHAAKAAIRDESLAL